MGIHISRIGILTTATLTLAGLTVVSQPAQAAAFTNGSFEVGPEPGSFVLLPTGSTAIPGWTVLGHSIDYTGSIWEVSDGARSLDLSGQGAGGVEQTFDTILGASYQVLFDLAGNPGGDPLEKGLTVGATGNRTQVYSFDTSGKGFTNMGWQTFDYRFTATSTSTSLLFSSLVDTPYGPALDNVRVSSDGVTPVPTPALLSGLVGMAVATWRQRRGETDAA